MTGKQIVAAVILGVTMLTVVAVVAMAAIAMLGVAKGIVLFLGILAAVAALGWAANELEDL